MRDGFGTSDEARYLIGVLDQVPALVVHDHFDQHVAWKESTLGGTFLTVLDFDNFFGRHKDAAELGLHTHTADALEDVAFDGLLHSRVSVYDVPAQIRMGSGRQQRVHFFRRGFNNFVGHYFLQPRMRSKNTHSSVLSVSQRKTDMIATKPNTYAVICMVSLRVGQTTFLTSRQESRPKAHS